jgi:outer membrane protein
MTRTAFRALLLGALLTVPGSPALADDLRNALALAYRTNPDLQAARANQRGTDESVPIARASALPSLQGTANYSEQLKTSQSSTGNFSPDRVATAEAQASMPLYAGGAIRNSIRAAKTRVEAGQAGLRGVESGVFAQVVAVYMDVIRDQAIVGLNHSNVSVLEVNLKAASDRFEIGDVTRTDVAQSNSRLALARGDLRTAEASLVASRERYIQIVGKAPVDLAPPPPLAGLPPSPEEAVQIALDSNPDLARARLASKAAGYDVRVAGAGRLPRLSVFTNGGYTNYLGSLPSVVGGSNHGTTASAGLSATIPLFQGGLPAARERQAQAVEGAALEQEIGVEREVIATVRSAYSSWRAANDVISMNQTAVDAAALSLEGVRAENTVGNRTILNILDAEQELLRAQVQLVAARRNAYVAGFNLLATMGKAEAGALSLDAEMDNAALYDPNVNYDRVKGNIWDWSQDPDPKAQSTRTVDTPSQNATIPPQPEP